MILKRPLTIALATATLALAQAPPAGQRTGPGVQAPQDAKEPEVLAGCKTPPPARGAGNPEPPGAKDYTVMEIPGVIAAGQKWKEVWQVSGNNADGIIGTKD